MQRERDGRGTRGIYFGWGREEVGGLGTGRSCGYIEEGGSSSGPPSLVMNAVTSNGSSSRN